MAQMFLQQNRFHKVMIFRLNGNLARIINVRCDEHKCSWHCGNIPLNQLEKVGAANLAIFKACLENVSGCWKSVPNNSQAPNPSTVPAVASQCRPRPGTVRSPSSSARAKTLKLLASCRRTSERRRHVGSCRRRRFAQNQPLTLIRLLWAFRLLFRSLWQSSAFFTIAQRSCFLHTVQTGAIKLQVIVFKLGQLLTYVTSDILIASDSLLWIMKVFCGSSPSRGMVGTQTNCKRLL